MGHMMGYLDGRSFTSMATFPDDSSFQGSSVGSGSGSDGRKQGRGATSLDGSGKDKK